MSDEIYVMWQFNTTEKRRDLTKEELEEMGDKIGKSFKEVGAKRLLHLLGISGKWTNIMIQSFPNLEAYVTYRKATGFGGLDVDRYIVSERTICKKVGDT